MNQAFDPPPYQPPLAPQKNNSGLVIGLVIAVCAVPVLLVCMGIMIGLLLPAVQAAREAARRMQCSNNMKQIVLALHNYESVYKTFPPAFTTDANGLPLHSWRTLILPYMEQSALYQSIDLSKPWDDPVNLAIAQTIVPTYCCPSVGAPSTNTVYQVILDPKSTFPGAKGIKIREITDGTSNTLAVVETSAGEAVPWMSPQDTDLNSFMAPASGHHTGGCNCAFCDGSVQFISSSMEAVLRQGLITRDGGESVTPF